MSIEIRRSESPEEVAICARFMAESEPWNKLYFSENQCLQNLSDPNFLLYIAVLGNEVLGFIVTRPKGMEGEPLIEYVCVSSDHRNRGIGSQLLTFVEESLHSDSDNIYLFVSDINPKAMNWYLRVGYKKIGELPNYNLFGQTEYLFRKFRRPRQERYRLGFSA